MISKFALILLIFNNILIQSISNLHVWYEWLNAYVNWIILITNIAIYTSLIIYIPLASSWRSGLNKQHNGRISWSFVSYMQVWYRLDKYTCIIKNKQNQCKFWNHRRLLLSQPPSPALRLLLLKKFGPKSLNYHWNISKNCIWDNMGVEGPR